jgi:hypothetical protein
MPAALATFGYFSHSVLLRLGARQEPQLHSVEAIAGHPFLRDAREYKGKASCAYDPDGMVPGCDQVGPPADPALACLPETCGVISKSMRCRSELCHAAARSGEYLAP